MLLNKLNTERLEAQKRLVQPILRDIYTLTVFLNILFNPLKLNIIYALVDYWTSVSKRGFFSFIGTGGISVSRINVTKDIVKAISLPNKDFHAFVRHVTQPMQDENSELFARLNRVLINTTYSNVVDGLSSFYLTNTAIQYVCILLAYQLNKLIMNNVIGEHNYESFFDMPLKLFLVSAALKTSYDYLASASNAPEIAPRRPQ